MAGRPTFMRFRGGSSSILFLLSFEWWHGHPRPVLWIAAAPRQAILTEVIPHHLVGSGPEVTLIHPRVHHVSQRVSINDGRGHRDAIRAYLVVEWHPVTFVVIHTQHQGS